MEIGAVKQAFNNELILLKKNLNQARIQVIHKLTRKAKQLTEKKGPDAIRDKMRRKAESAVKEVMIIKKIKPKDIGKFIITHTGKLEEHLNKPQIDNDKACARLLLHKALQEKYKTIRNRFLDIPIKDLFMSRQERKKLKKEQLQKKKDKRNKSSNNNVVNAEGDWDVEEMGNNNKVNKTDKIDANSDNDESIEEDLEPELDSEPESNNERFNVDPTTNIEESENESNSVENSDGSDDVKHTKESIKRDRTDIGEFVKLKSPIEGKKSNDSKTNESTFKLKSTSLNAIGEKKPEKRKKDINKNKNLNEKILKKKFKRDNEDLHVTETKIIDPFFITASGDNYMSVAEPRQPDEFKEEHRQGNRKLRRAAMFGHTPKIKPRSYKQDNRYNNFDKSSNFDTNDRTDNQNGFNRFNRVDNQNKYQNNGDKFNQSNSNTKFDKSKPRFNDDSQPEKLHPSWEAKKKKSGILPFEGKKIVFDDS